MTLTGIDWGIIVAYLAVALGIGVAFSRRAGRSAEEFFVSGRSLPWWIAGTSMVATTFAADTPLAVTGFVFSDGLAGNWFWWAFAAGGMITVFVYARLWRRAGVITDVELIELRYGGRPAAFLRGFRAVYVALLINAIIIGWVAKAMMTVLKYTVFSGSAAGGGTLDWAILLGLFAIVAVYSTLSGMWGVVLTDFVQFIIAMGGCIVLAVVGVRHIGGVDALRERVIAQFPGGEQAFRFLPEFRADDPWMPIGVFLVLLFVQWWATWYPGAEPGGGGYIVQRMASCRDERHSLLATLWYQVANYCLRPWPWIMTAFVALALYPELRGTADPGAGFPMVIRDIAPAGLRGLMLVAFFAAFMSTLSTQVNWGASYLVNDLYRRFIAPEADDRRLAWASRIASILVLVVGAVAAWIMRDLSVDRAWKFLAALGAGTGAVFMLRWFWWRISAWTEITAMIASLFFFAIVRGRIENESYQMAVVAALTIITWLVVTFLLPPERPEILERFYRRVQPAGPGWKPVARLAPDVRPTDRLLPAIAAAILGSAIVYLVLPGVGFVIFHRYARAAACLAAAAACSVVLALLIRRTDRDPAAD